jgi:hypothetical protein
MEKGGWEGAEVENSVLFFFDLVLLFCKPDGLILCKEESGEQQQQGLLRREVESEERNQKQHILKVGLRRKAEKGAAKAYIYVMYIEMVGNGRSRPFYLV